jgi:hypothetical protein
MIRSFAYSIGAGVVLAAATVSPAGEVYPVVHNEPIAIRVLSGKDGRPLAHVRLNLYAGYDEQDIRSQIWHEETLTDDHGQAWLSKQLANLPFLQVRPAKMRSCQTNARASRFSVELIRRDGLSTTNRCGVVLEKNEPGVLTLYVKARGATASVASASAQSAKWKSLCLPVPRLNAWTSN